MTAKTDDSKSGNNNDTKSSEDEKQSADWRDRILNSKFFNDNSAKKEERWGYDLYPERKQLFKSSLTKIFEMEEGHELYDKMRCERNVFACVKRSPLVKTMMGALKSAGW